MLLSFVSCSNIAEITTDKIRSNNDTKKSSLTLSFVQSVQRTVLPEFDMTVASYSISGVGPDNELLSRTNIVENSVTINDITIGSWVFTVNAYNTDGVLVGNGSSSSVIILGVNSVSVTISPCSGDGTFSYSLTWPQNYLNKDNIEFIASLSPVGGDVITLTSFSITEDENTNTVLTGTQSVASGYYLLTIQIKENGIIRYSMPIGNNSVIRIIKDQVTISNLTFGPNSSSSLRSLSITKIPDKINYWLEESLDLTGIELKGIYSSGEVRIIPISEVTVPNFDSSTPGEKTIKVSKDGVFDTFAVQVENIALSQITITSLPTKLQYAQGEALNKNGLVVTGTYSDVNSTQRDLTSAASITGFDSNTCGVKTLTVTIGSFTRTFDITVVFSPPYSFSAVSTSKNTIELNWSLIQGAEAYQIYYSTQENGTYTHLYTSSYGNIVTYTHSGLTADSCYYYKIYSIKDNELSALASTVNCRTYATTSVSLSFPEFNNGTLGLDGVLSVPVGANFNITATEGFSNYYWYLNGAMIETTDDSSNQLSLNTTGFEKKKYQILVVAIDDKDNSFSASSYFRVSGNIAISLPVFTSEGTTITGTFDLGDSNLLSVSSENGYTDYYWYIDGSLQNDNDGNRINTVTFEKDISNLTTGTHYILVVAIDNNQDAYSAGCYIKVK